jgi:microcystin-dependent protein
MADVGQALTDSLPRDGSAPMIGPLTLTSAVPTQARHATSKAYVDNFMAYATGMPVGAVFAYAAATAPTGYLLCDGALVSRVTYATLFAAIGTTYGSGDGSTTFNVPDLRDWFIRGKGASRTIGSTQGSALGIHTHGLSDPGHNHAISNPTHSHTDSGHAHTVTDPGHSHSTTIPLGVGGGRYWNSDTGAAMYQASTAYSSSAAATGIGVAAASANIQASAQATSAAAATTGVSIGSFGDTETRPQNMAMNYYIKATDDSVGPGGALLGITSADDNAISIDNTLLLYPQIVPHTNVAFGLVKLDANNKVPPSLLPVSSQVFMGTYDCSTGNNPSLEFPTVTFVNGDTYLVVVAGTILVYDPVTYIAAPTLVAVGSTLVYIDNGVNPVGWYALAAVATTTASNVSFSPAGGVSSTNVQSAIIEVNTNVVAMAIALG